MYVFVPTSTITIMNTHRNLHCVVVFVSGVYCFIIMMCMQMCVCVHVRELCSKDVHTFCFAIAVCDHIYLDLIFSTDVLSNSCDCAGVILNGPWVHFTGWLSIFPHFHQVQKL